MATPHLSADDGAIAPTVLMPGDPRRAHHIADRFLADARLVSDVRGMTGFTGTWKGQPISAIPSGMGIPSAAIYITELARFYGVARIIRVGTAGVYRPELTLRSVVAADTAVTNSGLPARIGVDGALSATPALVEAAGRAASRTGVELHIGTAFSSDIFYEPDDETRLNLTDDGVLCVEMETAGLYALAQVEGFEALAMLTMTDHLVSGEHLNSDERQLGVDEMIELALDVAIA